MRNPRLVLIYIVAYLAILAGGCVSDPNAPAASGVISSGNQKAYVLCEGIWNMDNSRIDCYDLAKDSLFENIFAAANPGLHIGDLAFSFARFGDTAFVSVTTAGVIYAIRLSDFRSCGMIKLDGDPAPRKIFIQNREKAYITNLYDSSVTVFNPTTLALYPTKIQVGPAPEGITGAGDMLFVANSGYGDYLADKPLAGTISVINTTNNSVITNMYCGPNPIELLYNKSNRRLYAVYYHLPSAKDSVGGIVEYNIDDFSEIRRFRCSAHSLKQNNAGDTLYYLNNDGLWSVPIGQRALSAEKIIDNPTRTHMWYSVSISPFDNSFWIGNAKTYAVKGEIIVYSSGDLSQPKFRFPTGINPNSVLFY